MTGINFVPYKLAVQLKELGFDYSCNHYYDIDKILVENHKYKLDDVFTFGESPTLYDNFNALSEYNISAPTLQQVQTWLRNEKGIMVEPYAVISEQNWAYRLYYTSHNGKFGMTVVIDGKSVNIYEFNSYDDALYTGIHHAVELITKKIT